MPNPFRYFNSSPKVTRLTVMTYVRFPLSLRQVGKLPKELCKSLTWDRGTEPADHKRFAAATEIDTIFCEPHSPWQRGSNENTNCLLRQHLLKGIDLSGDSQAS